MKTMPRCLLAAVAVALLAPYESRAQITFTQVAISGDDAVDDAGNPTGEDFDWFADVVLNSWGGYAFRAGRAWSANVNRDNDSGLWSNTWDDTMRQVALEGEPAADTENPPGSGIWAYFRELIGSGYHPSISDSGTVVFRSRLFIGDGADRNPPTPYSEATTYTDFGAWAADLDPAPPPGATLDLIKVVREKDDALDENSSTTGSTFDLRTLNPVVSDGDGSVAFMTSLYVLRADSNATGRDRNGIWWWDRVDLWQVARTAAWDDLVIETAPGTASKHFGRALQAGMNSTNDVAFAASLRNEPRLDDLGNPISDQVTGKNRDGIWYGQQGGLELLVRGGDDSWLGVPFLRLYSPAVNGAGDVAFRARLLGGMTGASRDADTGIWTMENAVGGRVLASLAREGDPAPGTGASFGEFRYDPVCSDSGDVVFLTSLVLGVAGVDRDNDTGIWVGDSAANLALLAREEDVAYIDPSVPTPIPPPTGSADVRFARFERPAVNRNGQVAFMAWLKSAPTGLTRQENRAIFAEQHHQATNTDTLLMVIRLGDTTLVPGKTVTGLSFVGNSGDGDGKPRGWTYDASVFPSGAGQLAFVASFDDDTSGVFIAEIPTVP